MGQNTHRTSQVFIRLPWKRNGRSRFQALLRRAIRITQKPQRKQWGTK